MGFMGKGPVQSQMALCPGDFKLGLHSVVTTLKTFCFKQYPSIVTLYYTPQKMQLVLEDLADLEQASQDVTSKPARTVAKGVTKS